MLVSVVRVSVYFAIQIFNYRLVPNHTDVGIGVTARLNNLFTGHPGNYRDEHSKTRLKRQLLKWKMHVHLHVLIQTCVTRISGI